MNSRREALEQIATIAREHELSAADIASVLKRTDDEASTGAGSVLGRILGYLGGTFIFAGLAIYIALNWDVMNTAARIIITLGSGIALFVMALVASTDKRYTRVKTPLYLIAAALQPVGIMVAFDELSQPGDWHYPAMATALIMFVQQAAVFWQKRDTTLLFTSVVFALWFFGVSLDLLKVNEELVSVILGASTVCLCLGLEKTPHRGMNPFWYLAGSAVFFSGLFELVEGTPVELVFLACACGGVFLSTWVRSRALLFVSTVAILGYIGYFTAEHFRDSLGWPLVLILLGLAFIALSAIAMRINRRYISNSNLNTTQIEEANE